MRAGDGLRWCGWMLLGGVQRALDLPCLVGAPKATTQSSGEPVTQRIVNSAEVVGLVALACGSLGALCASERLQLWAAAVTAAEPVHLALTLTMRPSVEPRPHRAEQPKRGCTQQHKLRSPASSQTGACSSSHAARNNLDTTPYPSECQRQHLGARR
jgi:hypothetical protein